MVCIKVKKLSRMIRNMSLFLVLAMFFLSAPVLSAEETISEASTGILTKLADNDKAKGKIEDINKDIESLKKYATTEGYSEAKSSPGDTKLLDTYQHIQDTIEELYRDKHITLEERNQLKEDASRLYKTAADQVIKTADAGGDTKTRDKVQEEIAAATVEYGIAECPTSGQLRARYHAGCWSCLVLEKLTSAFLHAANHGLKVVQKAGLTLLWLGTAIWIVFWGLKNVSSFTEIQLGNILNDLIKFLFKVAVAYWFIVYSPTAISQYFIKPIMSVGAIIAQQFWDTEVKEFTQEWQYDEFIDDDDPRLNGVKEDEEEDKPKTSSASTDAAKSSAGAADVPAAEEPAPAVEEPKLVEPSGDEEIVQSLQKAFIAILEQQWREVTNSCGASRNSACGKSCKSFNSCNKAPRSHAQGHIDYVVNNIMAWAGYKGNNHYCQASVTAGMKKLAEKIGKTPKGKKLLHVLNGAGAGCALGYGLFGYTAGEDIQICQNGKLLYTKINVADTIWIHGNKGTNQRFGGGSGHHAVTALDNKGNILSFNGDSRWNVCSVYKNLIGKVGCISCKFRELLKQHPELKNEIDTKTLASLAAGYNVSFINYEGGAYSNVSGDGTGTTAVDYDSLIVEIPEVKYTGPTNIMPKSVMNSILGATRAITNTTADVMVMGDMMMCYASAKNGGAWHVQAWVLDLGYWTNFVMWIQGGIIWCLGFMLTVSIAYYLVDISFKIGFAVLAIPVMMGLWPFGFTQGKIFIAISIIAKSAATFAFLALTTAFGMGLVGEAVNGLEELYGNMDALTQGETDDEEIRARVSDTLYLFSPTFVLLIFAILYFYKMVQQTISDLVNKFFPDQAFGDSSPMHSGATMATSYLKRFAMKASGADLAKDIVAHQTGRLVKGGLKRAGAAASYPIRHPMKSTRAAVHAIAHPVKTAKAVGNASVKGAKAVGNATVKGAKAVGNAVRHPVRTGKAALNAAGRGIKKGWNRASGKE